MGLICRRLLRIIPRISGFWWRWGYPRRHQPLPWVCSKLHLNKLAAVAASNLSCTPFVPFSASNMYYFELNINSGLIRGPMRGSRSEF